MAPAHFASNPTPEVPHAVAYRGWVIKPKFGLFSLKHVSVWAGWCRGVSWTPGMPVSCSLDGHQHWTRQAALRRSLRWRGSLFSHWQIWSLGPHTGASGAELPMRWRQRFPLEFLTTNRLKHEETFIHIREPGQNKLLMTSLSEFAFITFKIC